VTLKDSEITAIITRLAELDAERASLLKRLSESQTPMTSDSRAVALPSVTAESRGREKIELFAGSSRDARCVPSSLGESEDRTVRLFTRLL